MTKAQAGKIKNAINADRNGVRLTWALMPHTALHPFYICAVLMVCILALLNYGFSPLSAALVVIFAAVWLIVSTLCVGDIFLVKALDVMAADGE